MSTQLLKSNEARVRDASAFHSTTLPIALFLYFSVVSNGLGLSTAFLRHPSMVSLGAYTLHVYLFQTPFMELIGCKLNGYGSGWALSSSNRSLTLSGEECQSVPANQFTADYFTLLTVLLWLFCALYINYIETPIASLLTGRVLPRLFWPIFDKITRCCCVHPSLKH